ncbi:MAG TPA: nuclear transport factor 2 family protein [Thermoleophilaceae bacterium]|jgi:ketosteroid isomerase-like protein|nr:nuclear transport factor 2 family protein [Thermoleophilaceae bacterium]
MALAHVELVLAAIDAYNRRDVEALSALMVPDVELRPPVMALSGRAYRGHAGVHKWLADVEESWSTARIHPSDVTEAGDCVLALTTFRVEGGESRLRFESELGLLCSIRDDLIASWHGHFNHAAARAEAAEAAQSSSSTSDSGPSDSDSGTTGGGGGRNRSSARPSSSSP